ncbi:MAG: thiopeptide-type bacteriocin biosynthesis protein, partial [Daejeonella sp.]|nr:thiopeptide-type bacteriocin biosynthesis protein [Daejeonella sp.]
YLHQHGILLDELAVITRNPYIPGNGARYFRKQMKLHNQLILRIPRYPVNNASQSLDKVLLDPVFRDALYLASDSITDELNRNGFQPGHCTEKMKNSLMKYHKRICYRPTPFGAFAGLTVLPWQESKDPGIIITNESFQTLVLKKELHQQTDRSSTKKYYRVNPFLYPYGTDFRILRKGKKSDQSTFTISEIFSSDPITNLASGKQIISQASLLELLNNSGIDKDELDSYIKELLELQIILPYQHISREFPNPLTPKHKEYPGSSYDSYSRVSLDGSLPEGLKEQLDEALYCLEELSTQYELQTLTNFKIQFEKLFERKEVSLLQALDPELGIDYESLDNNHIQETGMKIPERISWSPIHKLLLGKWTAQSGNEIPEIEILEKDLRELNNPQRNYPPGYSVIFSLSVDHLHIKAAGGVSSLNMIGRFTALDPDIQKLGRKLAEMEMAVNPDVLFAEISHLDSSQLASVNTRAMLYDYQIPLFEDPKVADDFVIGLNDLYISLVDNCLQLWSSRLKMRIIPRFSCAYNYPNSHLPIFRFLCDLQYEGIYPNLNFSMVNLFPGLPAYPRLTYKGIILESASWHLNAKQLWALKKLDPSSQYTEFSSIAIQIGLPEEICYEVHDHLLHIKISCAKDVNLLLKTIPETGIIVFREYDNGQESLVKDNQGNSYTHECIAFLTNREKSYSSYSWPIKPLINEKDKLFPFDEWLYFKLYMHPFGYKDLLLNYIQPFISKNTSNGNISTWFFISYLDEESHLRLRLKQMPGREAKLLKSYKKLENSLRHLPNLKKLELSTYIREQERYSSIGIELAEDLFGLSSEIVLSTLNLPFMDGSSREKLFQAIRHLWIIFNGLKYDLSMVVELSMNLTRHLTKNRTIEFDLE